MANLADTIEESIKRMHDKIDASVDKEWLKTEHGPLFERLQRKQKEGTLDLRDFKDLLKIYRNVLIPAVKKQTVERLRGIKGIVEAHGAMGISESS